MGEIFQNPYMLTSLSIKSGVIIGYVPCASLLQPFLVVYRLYFPRLSLEGVVADIHLLLLYKDETADTDKYEGELHRRQALTNTLRYTLIKVNGFNFTTLPATVKP